MYNKKSVTFAALDSYFLNTANGKLNTGYLNDCIYNIFDVDYRSTNGGNGRSKLNVILTDKKRKNNDLIMEAFKTFADYAIENECINSRYKYTATHEHLTAYLAQYGHDMSVFDPLVEELEYLRKDEEEKLFNN